MRVMVFGKATKDSEAGAMPTAQAWEEMERFQGELVKAGIVLAAEGLMPSSKGVRTVSYTHLTLPTILRV